MCIHVFSHVMCISIFAVTRLSVAENDITQCSEQLLYKVQKIIYYKAYTLSQLIVELFSNNINYLQIIVYATH